MPDTLPPALRDARPEWAFVLGSGLGAFADALEDAAVVPYAEVPGLPASKVQGHAGRFVAGSLGGVRVLVAQGRVHLYEGHSAAAVTAAVRLFGALGIPRLVLTNAAGTANPDFAPGGWMMLSDHLNLTGATPLLGGAHFVDMTAAYSPGLRARFRAAADALGIGLNEGVYAGLLGPQYETPAEVRMLRALGADAVGMSTVLEAIQARALGIETCAFSCLTNWAAGISGQPLSHAEVMETGARAAGDLIRLFKAVLESPPDETGA